ncbi:MAG: winged helix-turn-helix transcriptional regulator [Beijerinckiaceae bacterium]
MASRHHTPDACPVEHTLAVIGGRWKPVILFHLRSGKRRFNEFRRLIPDVTQRMLTQHLRELESDGIISRHVHPVVPPHVDYEITDVGASLMPILEAMAEWGMQRRAVEPAASASQ